MQRFFIMPCLLVLAACASAGVKVDQAKLSQLHKGKSTYNEVIETLGQPTQTMVADNGDKTIHYTYFSTQARPESFIPYVGAFVGGADMENSHVTLTFDHRDVLKSYASSQGATGAGTGFEAYSQPRNSSQPRKE